MINDFGQSNLVTVEHYLGIEICTDKSEYFFATVWSEESQSNEDVYGFWLEDVKLKLNEILAYNYYESLTEIQLRFRHKPDFCNPEQNGTNLAETIKNKISEIEF